MRTAAGVAGASAEFQVHSLTSSELALHGEVGEITPRLWELGDEVARIRRDGDRKMEDVLLERGCLQVRIDCTASRLGGS